MFGVVVGSQALGLLLALSIALIRGEPIPSLGDAAWAAGAGACGAIGIAALYAGLAAGRMGVVAPVAAVVTAAIPVVAGAVLQGPPGPARAAGIVLALVAVILVSRSSAPGPGRAGIRLGLLAGLGFGLFALFISRVSGGLVFGPLAIARAASVALMVATVIASRRPWRVSRSAVSLVLLAGALDMAGNGFFILAAQSGRLDVAAVLSSLYPVTTILLATVLLRERLVRGHAFGVALALVAIVLIGAG